MATNKKIQARQLARQQSHQLITAADVGLPEEKYLAAIAYLFHRPEEASSPGSQAWFWNDDEPEFGATETEWVKLQSLIFDRCGSDLKRFSDEQVGMGLNYLMSNAVSDVPYAATHNSVPLAESMQLMSSLIWLWQDCFAQRLANRPAEIGSGGDGTLGYVNYMWFDVWPTFRLNKESLEWREAMWQHFCQMLGIAHRDIQISALHGLGHNGVYLNRQKDIDHLIHTFIATIPASDQELIDYAEAARQGMVQ